MKLKGEEFWKLTALQKEIVINQKEIAIEELEVKVKKQSQRINELEKTLIEVKIGHKKEKARNKIDELNKCRNEIAKRLKVKSLDSFIIDTDSYELIKEEDVT